MKTFLKISLLLVLTACNSKIAQEHVGGGLNQEKIGTSAPAFQLESTDGKTIRLSDYEGQVVLLDFWATWCPPCRMTIPILVRINKQFEGRDFAIIGISLDQNQRPVLPYIRSKNVEHTIVYGAGTSVGDDYEVIAIPTFLLVDGDGILRKVYQGYYPGMEREWVRDIEELLQDRS